jgi:hypothetical protein
MLIRSEEGARVTRRDGNFRTGRWQIVATKDQGRTDLDDTRYVPIWPYARAQVMVPWFQCRSSGNEHRLHT